MGNQVDSCCGIPPDLITYPGLLSLRYSKEKKCFRFYIFVSSASNLFFFLFSHHPLFALFFLDLGGQSISYFAFEIVAI